MDDATGNKTLRWRDVGSPVFWDTKDREHPIVMLDQRRLPTTELWRRYGDDATVAEAIRTMVVRGAPAIGCAAAFGLAASARRYPDDAAGFQAAFDAGAARLAASRPTAVNLFWALERQRDLVARVLPDGVPATRDALVAEAQAIWREDVDACKTIGRLGAPLIPANARILTHCNAGALATAGYGTALGVIRAAQAAGKKISVYADETRPFLQGARLTAWELHESDINVTLICDNMAGTLMRQGSINCCVVGADRIAKNGDVANKIGTYMVAVLAARHHIPFYVAAPLSTLDLNTETGDAIPIEERPAREVTHIGDTPIAPAGVPVRNIAFDVTPANLVTAIITERGIATPPYEESLAHLQALDRA